MVETTPGGEERTVRPSSSSARPPVTPSTFLLDVHVRQKLVRPRVSRLQPLSQCLVTHCRPFRKHASIISVCSAVKSGRRSTPLKKSSQPDYLVIKKKKKLQLKRVFVSPRGYQLSGWDAWFPASQEVRCCKRSSSFATSRSAAPTCPSDENSSKY